jgi:hypothetical protein
MNRSTSSTPERLWALRSVLAALAVLAGGFLWWASSSGPRLDGRPADSHIAAVVLEVSALPDPTTLDYKDVAYVAKVETVGIIDGRDTPRELLILIQGIADRKRLPAAGVVAGDRIELGLVPYDESPDRLRRMQRIDTIAEFQLDLYAAVASQKWEAGAFDALVAEHTRETSRAPIKPEAPVAFPDRRTPRERALRQKAIDTDLSRIQLAVDRSGGGSVAVWSAALRPWSDALLARSRANGGFLLESGRFLWRLYEDDLPKLKESGVGGGVL